MRRISYSLTVVVAMLCVSAPSFAAPILSIVPFETSGRTGWGEIIEAESASATKSGSHSVFNVAPGPWNSGVWLFTTGSYVEVSFTTPGDTLVVQFEADSNDGVAEFIVDASSVGTVDTYNQGWIGVEISGLSNAAHTLRVRAAGAHPGTGANDIAIDVLGVLASNVVPEPATTALLCAGLLGLGAARRRR